MPKPVQFPPPSDVAVEIDGIKYIALSKFIELKLASGMTGGAHRAKDLVDVGELINAITFPNRSPIHWTPLCDPPTKTSGGSCTERDGNM